MFVALSVILAVLLIIAFFWLFSLKKSLRAMTRELASINEEGLQFRQLVLESPDPSLEELAVEINRFMKNSFLEQDKQNQKEELLRKEITNISHDLRTPLTSILGYLELTKEEALTKEQKEYLDIVTKRARHLTGLVSQLYEYTRLESGEYPMEYKKIDLMEVFREHLLEFYGDFEAKGIEVSLTLPEYPCFIRGDFAALNRIFQNLTSNCLKYGQKTVNISLLEQKNEFVIQYQNPAPAMSEADVHHLFDRFYQADSSRTGAGSGLGLTVAKLLTEKMNGKIRAERNDRWLSIIVTIPSAAKTG